MVDFSLARTKMVDSQLRPNDMTDHGIIDAFLELPRETFVAGDSMALAYIDRDLPIGQGRVLLSPTIEARLIQAADIKAGDKVLDVGGGTGYAAAVVAKLGATVIALECDHNLSVFAKVRLAGLGLDNVTVAEGDLPRGVPAHGPYDAILLHGSVEVPPTALLAQLAEGGRLVVIEGVGKAARLVVYTRSGDNSAARVIMNAAAPVLPGFAKPVTFQF